MMSDEICKATGHTEWTYYFNPNNEEGFAPAADSEDLYYGHGTDLL